MKDLLVFADHARPGSATPLPHLLGLPGGSRASMAVRLLDTLTRAVGVAISLTAIIGPWLLRGAQQLRALWCVCAGLVAVYLPVHLEPRYLTPAVPLICLLAVASAARAARGKRGTMRMHSAGNSRVVRFTEGWCRVFVITLSLASLAVAMPWPASAQPYVVDRKLGVAYGPLPAEKGDLYAPVIPLGPLPAVIVIHGGGWIEGCRLANSRFAE